MSTDIELSTRHQCPSIGCVHDKRGDTWLVPEETYVLMLMHEPEQKRKLSQQQREPLLPC